MQAYFFHINTYVSSPYIHLVINRTILTSHLILHLHHYLSHTLFLSQKAFFRFRIPSMASHDRDRHTTHQVQVHPIGQPSRFEHGDRFEHGGDKSHYYRQQQGPSTSKVLAVMALLPVGGALLGLAGITLVGTLIGSAVATPVFILFSPIIVPAFLAIGLAVTGFLTSGTFGLTGLSSLSYLINCLRQMMGSVPEEVDAAKLRLRDLVDYTGQKTKDAGQTIKDVAHEIGPEGQVHGGAGAKGEIRVGGRT